MKRKSDGKGDDGFFLKYDAKRRGRYRQGIQNDENYTNRRNKQKGEDDNSKRARRIDDESKDLMEWTECVLYIYERGTFTF